MLKTMSEAVANQEARLHAMERRFASGDDLSAEETGDMAAQLHRLTEYVSGLGQKVGYIHKPPAR